MFQNGNFMNQMGGFLGFQQRLGAFKQQLDNSGAGNNYEQMVQNLMNSGQMSQEQFNYFRMIANQITGKNL